jgi:hypothetical protein
MKSASSDRERKRNPRGLFSLLKGPLLIFLFALFFYSLADKIEEVPIPGQLGPAFWPKMILILLMVSCGIKAGEILMAQRRGELKITEEEPPKAVNTLKLGAMIAMIIAVVLSMEAIGFPLANFLFLLLFMRIAGLRKEFSLVSTSVLGTVLLLYVFVKVVYLPLPKGQWFFADLTIFLYRVLYII